MTPYLTAQKALDYASNVIEGRLPEAEPIIAQNAYWAYHYARHIIKGPWPNHINPKLDDYYLDMYNKFINNL